MGSRRPLPRPVSSDLYNREYLLRHCGGHELYAASRGLQLDERLSAIFELAQIEPGMRVLDVGCGRGELTLHGGLSGGVTWGVDLSTEAVGISLETLRLAPKGLTGRAGVLRATALRLPFHNGHFHRVFLSDILEHLLPAELSQTLSEVHRVIRDDGCAVFHTFPNRWFYSVYYPLRRLFWEIPRGQAGPRNPRTIYERRMHVNELSPLGLMRALRPFFRTRLWCAHRSRWNADSGGFRGKRGPFDWIAQPEIWGIGVKLPRPMIYPAGALMRNLIDAWRAPKMGEEIKSTLDLVMERFKTEEDVVQLTDEQKQEIASIRKHYEAKIAEARILLTDKEELSIEISRLERQRDEKLERVRKEAK